MELSLNYLESVDSTAPLLGRLEVLGFRVYGSAPLPGRLEASISVYSDHIVHVVNVHSYSCFSASTTVPIMKVRKARDV